MRCSISNVKELTEEVWIVSIPTDKVHELIVRFIAFEYGKIDSLCLRDVSNKLFVQLERITDKKPSPQTVLNFGGNRIPIYKEWCKAIVSMLLDVGLWGWTDTAHLDFDLSTDAGIISACFRVIGPGENF